MNTDIKDEQVVLPEPDAVIGELMGLVDEWGMESHLRGEAELDAQHSEATQEEIDCAKDRASKERAAWKAIESKLRALLATATGLPRHPHCSTCNDHGAVGNILTAEPCPDCTVPAIKAQADARDAERYRWLRVEVNSSSEEVNDTLDDFYSVFRLKSGEELDAAVDAAIAAAKGE